MYRPPRVAGFGSWRLSPGAGRETASALLWLVLNTPLSECFALLQIWVSLENTSTTAAVTEHRLLLLTTIFLPERGWYSMTRRVRNYLPGLPLTAARKPHSSTLKRFAALGTGGRLNLKRVLSSTFHLQMFSSPCAGTITCRFVWPGIFDAIVKCHGDLKSAMLGVRSGKRKLRTRNETCCRG